MESIASAENDVARYRANQVQILTPASNIESEKMECELTKYCQSVTGFSDFYPWSFKRISNGILMRGARCPLVTRGKRKGNPNWRKMDKHTIQDVFKPFTPAST